MLEIKAKYLEAKLKAKQMMGSGNVTAYIAQLLTIQELQLQISNHK